MLPRELGMDRKVRCYTGVFARHEIDISPAAPAKKERRQ
jgi:hypothetical protein